MKDELTVSRNVPGQDERGIGELFTELAGETGTLIRQEISLAQVEITNKAASVGRNVGVVAAGGAVANAGLLAIMAGIILIVSYAIPLWMAAILVGGTTAVGSYMAISASLTELRNLDVTPSKTVDSLKEDARWLKKQVS
jgi:hypothetical protein